MGPSEGSGQPARTRGYKKKERTRKELLEAALEVIAQKGEAFTVSDVAARARVSSGTFYNYFADREALLRTLAPHLVRALAAESAQVAPGEDAALRVATITARALISAAADPTRARALLRLDVPRALVREGASVYLREDLAEGLRQGRFEVGPDDAMVDFVTGALVMGIRRVSDGQAAPGYTESLVARLLRSLGVAADEVVSLAERAVNRARELGPQPSTLPRFPG